MSETVLRRRLRKRAPAEPHEYERRTRIKEKSQAQIGALTILHGVVLTTPASTRAGRHSYRWNFTYHESPWRRPAPRIVNNRPREQTADQVLETDEVTVFIEQKGLALTIETALQIVRETFSDIESLQLDLDNGEGEEDRHVRIYVRSSANTGKAQAYDRFYDLLSQRVERDKWGLIGLTF